MKKSIGAVLVVATLSLLAGPPKTERVPGRSAPAGAPLRGPAVGQAGGSQAGPNWPGFRGPSASGVADGQQLPDTWDAAKGTNIRWKTPIPGLAHSSPIV